MPRHLIGGAIAAAIMALLPAAPCQAQQAGPVTVTPVPSVQTITNLKLPMNRSQVIRVSQPVGKIAVGNAAIVDAVVLTDRSFYILGKGLGSSNISVYGRDSQLLAVIDVIVGADVEGVKSVLYEMLPGETIEVRSINDAIALSGTVSTPTKANEAVAVAQRFAPNVINNLEVHGAQQVLLEVKVAEMSRTVTKQLGFKPLLRAGKNVSSVISNNPANPTGFTLATLDTIDPTRFAELIGNARIGGFRLSEFIDALEEKGAVKLLAEPNLVALSGDTASFLAGGEFPVPVAQNLSGASVITTAITVEFKPFGVSLSFTPTILGDGLMNLVVAPEVSQIDRTVSINENGLVIPGISTRRARTTIELRDGESFAIAGLLQNNINDDVRQIPGLGDVPVLGALFRSSTFQNQQSELVIIVTPHLVQPAPAETLAAPTDSFVPPTDVELFLLGKPEGAASGLSPQAGGGLIGRYGHIVR